MSETKGKNKRRQLSAYDNVHDATLSCDSQEEVDFIEWLNEAIELSVIDDFHYQPCTFELFKSEKYVDVYGKQRTLFREHSYTPDFMIEFDPNKNLELAKELKLQQNDLSNSSCSVYIDVKGTFNRTERSFGFNQKWVWQKFKTYIYKLVPTMFFKKFGVPEKCVLTAKTKKPRSCYRGFKTLKHYSTTN